MGNDLFFYRGPRRRVLRRTPLGLLLYSMFTLNIALAFFNLLPIPPLDGFGVLGLFTDSEGAVRLQQLRIKMRGFGMLIGILIASRLLGYVYDPLLEKGVRLIYAFYTFPR